MIDVHGCRRDRVTGSEWEGKVLQPEVTRPGQIEYGSMLPGDLDNLLVPVAVSASHVGFSAVRFEPAWMNLGEAAGYAAALAAESGTPPGSLEVTDLQRRLVDDGVLISFFNELDRGDDELDSALGFLGTKGFFDGYAARPDEPLTSRTGAVWSRTVGDLAAGEVYDPTERARRLPDESGDRSTISGMTRTAFVECLERELSYRGLDLDRPALRDPEADGATAITRGEAAKLCYRVLAE